MRKLILILIIAVLAFPCVGLCTGAADGEYGYEKEMEYVRLLNIFPDYNFELSYPSQPVLRESYSKIMNEIWGSAFADYADKKGMVTAEEAVKTSIDLLGYGERVKVSGYNVVASELKLTKNIKMATNREMTYGEFAALLYNMEDVAIYEITEIGDVSVKYDKSKDTFLTGVLKCREVKDILSDNGYTALASLSNVGKSNVKIGDETFVLGEKNEAARDLIGRKVRGYVTNDDDKDTQEVVGLTEEPYEEFAEFKMSDFVGLDGNVLTYEEDGENESVKLTATPNVIYNGKFEKSLKKEFFDYEYGNIFVGSSDGSLYDIVIIEGYVSWCLSLIDGTDMKLYPSDTDVSLSGGERVLNIDPQENEWVRMYDKYGDLGDMSDFYKNTIVDICENDGFVKLASVDKNVFEQTIKSRDDDYYYTDDAKYLISEKYEANKKSVIPEPGGMYDLYVNGFGYVIKAEKVSSERERVGLFIKAENIGDKIKASGQLKIFNTNGGIEIYDTVEKIKYTDSKNISETLTYQKLYSKLKNLSESIISYKLNADGKIIEVALPAEKGLDRKQGRLGCIMNNERAYYETTKGNLEGKAIVSDSQTKIFVVNISVTDEKRRYSYNSISNLGAESSYWTLYNTEPGSYYGEYGIKKVENKVSSLPGYTWFTITKLYKGVDEYGETMNYMEGYKHDGQRYTAAAKYFCDDSVLADVTDVAKSGTLYNVSEGDIVLVKLTLNEIDEMYVLYKHDQDKVGKKGMIAGNLGYHDPANTAISNPFVLGSSENALSDGAYTLPWRTIFGYVQHVDSRGNMTVTTQDLTAGDYDASMSDSRYTTEYVAPQAYLTEINYRNDKVKVKAATKDDVKAYDSVGADCSRVIICTWYGSYSRMLLINGGE